MEQQNGEDYRTFGTGDGDPNATGAKAKAVRDVQAGHATGATAQGDARIKDDYLGEPLSDLGSIRG